MNQKDNQNRNRKRSRGRVGGPKCPLCPTKGRDGANYFDKKKNEQVVRPQPNALPQGRGACYACVPEYKLIAQGSEGADRFYVVVAISGNGLPVSREFRWIQSGSNDWTTLKTKDETGTDTFSVPYGKKATTVSVILSGSIDPSNCVKLPVPADPTQKGNQLPEDGAQCVLIATASRDSATARILVETTVNRRYQPMDFAVQYFAQNWKFDRTAEVDDGENRRGVKVLEYPANPNSKLPRRAVIHLLGVQHPPVLVEIPPRFTEFQPPTIEPGSSIEMIVDFDKSENGHEVTVQTLVGSDQVGMEFSWHDGKKLIKREYTADGISNTDDPVGQKTLFIPYDGKTHRLKFYLQHGKAAVSNIVLPAIQPKHKKFKASKQHGFWGAIAQSLRGGK